MTCKVKSKNYCKAIHCMPYYKTLHSKKRSKQREKLPAGLTLPMHSCVTPIRSQNLKLYIYSVNSFCKGSARFLAQYCLRKRSFSNSICEEWKSFAKIPEVFLWQTALMLLSVVLHTNQYILLITRDCGRLRNIDLP